MAAPSRSAAGPNRSTFLAAAALFIAVGVGALVVSLLGPDAGRDDASTSSTVVVTTPDGSTVTAVERPSIVPEPNSGREPEDSGDRGGLQQTVLFGLIVLATAGIGVAIFRGSRRTRAKRAEWVAAAAPGQEEARAAAAGITRSATPVGATSARAAERAAPGHASGE